MPNTIVLMVAHGSPMPEAIAEVKEFKNQFAQRCPYPIRLAYLECAQPDLLAALHQTGKDMCRGDRVVILPLFLGAAEHYKNDLPVAIQWARRTFPEVDFVYAMPLGPHAHLITLLDLRIRQALEAASPMAIPCEQTVVLVVGRGSSDPDSNAEVARVARLLYEKRAFLSVEYAYQAVARPTISEGIERAARLGARQIVLAPYLLFTGWVEEKILEVAAERALQHKLNLVIARRLGVDPLLLDVVKQRLDEALGGNVSVACDICKYRLLMAGYEEQVGQPQVSNWFNGDTPSV